MKSGPQLIPGDEPFRSMSDYAPLLIWASGTDAVCNFFNVTWLKFTGRTMAQEYDDGWTEQVHPDDLERCLAVYTAAFKKRDAFARIYRLKRYDGLYRHIADRAAPQYNFEGTFTGYAGYGMDVEELAEIPRLREILFGITQGEQRLNEELAATNEELSASNEELAAANEELVTANEELIQTRGALAKLNENLEKMVADRTDALTKSEAAAQVLNEELISTNEELAAANEEMVTINEELVNSREEILKSEKLFKSIATNIPKSLIVVMDSDYRILAAEGELLYKTDNGSKFDESDPLVMLLPDCHCKPFYEKMLNGRQFTVDQKGAEDRNIRIEFVPLRDDLGEVYAGLIMALDITDIKLAEERSAKLAAIVASSDDAIVSKTLDGIVTSWNASAERIFGYSESEMVGEPILKIIPDDRLEEEPRILDRLRSGERVDHFETKRMTKDGRLLDVSLTISPVRDNDGTIIGASKIARDISEKKRDETRKNDFIGMVSHELKTPLTSLSALMQIVRSKLKNSPDTFITNALETAGKQVKKMDTLINGFLDISRLESGKMAVVRTQFMLDELLVEAIAELKLITAGNLIHIDAGEKVMVYADRDKIGLVILNLLTNAVKYSPPTSPVDASCRIVGGKAQVSVKDRGIGIKPGEMEKIFDRYYRAETDYTHHVSGFGIGLYLSSEIIRRHSGDIWVESEVGKGSTFYFTLPLPDK